MIGGGHPPNHHRRFRHMQDTRTRTDTGKSVAESPVDDPTYNVLQALTSKLEAIEAYEIYAEQDDSGLFAEMIQDERRHAERLLGVLKERLAGR
jgi:rubrerythrin